MTSEIPIWMNGDRLIVTGVNRKTTCEEVIKVLLQGRSDDFKEYAILERWKRVERPLDEKARILKVWSQWGDEKDEVRLMLKKVESEADSGRGSPPGGGGYLSSLRRRRNRTKVTGKPPWGNGETLHPKRLAELGEICRLHEDNCDYSHSVLEVDEKHKSYAKRQELYSSVGKRKMECKNEHSCTGTGILHSTLLPDRGEVEHKTKRCCKKRNKPKIRNSENIEKLMKLILAQGATIQTQLHRLKEREEQIEQLEHEKHRERLAKNGRNYLLETYLGSLGEAELPQHSDDEEKGNDSGVHTEGGSDQTNGAWDKKQKPTHEKKSDEHRLSRRAKVSEDKSLVEKRSKSESRTKDEDGKKLKRTNSASFISEQVSINNECGKEETQLQENAKEDTLELNKIQSQIEMWEKILRINQKLENEEENLVRLHVKIRKLQAENLKFDKEKFLDKSGIEGAAEEYDCLQKSLDKLRKDLDQNSKEIYQNFTSLISSDDEVVQKKNKLKNILSDLSRIEQETQNLQSVDLVEYKVEGSNTEVQRLDEDGVAGKNEETESHLEQFTTTVKACVVKLNEDEYLDHKNEEIKENINENDHCSIKEEINQDKIETLKPKTVKISFGSDVVQSENESVDNPEKLKEPAPANTPAKKGILKNRNYTNDVAAALPCETDLEKEVDYSSNVKTDVEETKISKLPMLTNINENVYGSTHPRTGPTDYPPYIYPINGDTFHNPIYGARTTSYGSELYTTRRILLPQRTNVMSQNSTLVTTRAQVHYDTDSNTSSETSGLSSMYSHSPTSDEGCVYVLDTLV